MNFQTIGTAVLICMSVVCAGGMVFLGIAIVRLIAHIDDPNEMGYELKKPKRPKVSTRLKEIIEGRRSELHIPKGFDKDEFAPDDESTDTES